MIRTIPARHRVLGVLLGVSVALVAFAFLASANTCQVKGSGCLATVSTAVYNGGPPYPICLRDHDIYRVTISGFCKTSGSFGPASGLVCSAVAAPAELSITADGRTHTLSLAKGTWEDVHNGNCDILQYSVN
jgi:hypothetical protein